MRIHIKNGRIIDPQNALDAHQDLFIANGKIAAIGAMPAGFTADQVIDATGLVVAPGFIDLSARLREPGYEYMATLETEMYAAVSGGVTSLVCPPDTDPPLDEPGLVEMLKHRAKNLNQSRVYPLGALTVGLKGQQLTEMAELCDAGCIGFSQADAGLTDTRVLERAMRYAATFGFTVWLRPQDAYLARGGVAHDGEVATRLGLPGIPTHAETIALATILRLAQVTGVRVHLARLSSAEAVEMVRLARAAGLPITCDVAIHHVHLRDEDIGFFDSNCHLIPPLRSGADRQALRAGLLDGTIDAICSDHAPVDEDAKQIPFAESAVGATGLELLLPLTLQWAREADLSLSEAIRRITVDPARILRIDAGHLTVGHTADVCVFKEDKTWIVRPGTLNSQGKNTPFTGKPVTGQVTHTLVDGQMVYEDLT